MDYGNSLSIASQVVPAADDHHWCYNVDPLESAGVKAGLNSLIYGIGGDQ
jgi:hypothetical protein